jgi:hypothetical protein
MVHATPDDTAKLVDLVQRLRSADANRRVHGSDHHNYQFRPTLPEADVREFESQHGVELPADYRNFLLHAGNGGAGPHYGMERLQTPQWPLSKPFPLTRSSEEMTEQELEPLGCPWIDYGGFLPLSHRGCAKYDNLIVCGPTYGTIWASWEFSLYCPTGLSFTDWYRDWAMHALRLLSNEKYLVPLIKLGMSRADVIAAVGGEWTKGMQWDENTWSWWSPDIPAHIRLDQRETVVEVEPWACI